MRARARARSRLRIPAEGRGAGMRLPMLAAGVALGAFIIGYGITALAFGTARGPTDVAMVPDVRRVTVEAAARLLDDAGLKLEVGDSLPNAEAPAGAILAQSPLPGEEVSPGTAIRVILSTGQPKLTVPEVEAMPVALATRALEAAGFTVTTEDVPGMGSRGRVIDVSPRAGTAVALPATIHLRIGAAASRLEMPPVIGMLEENARNVIEAYGLRVTEVQYERTPFGEPGGVVSQDPEPGDSIAPGDAVRLRVTEPGEAESRGIMRGSDRSARENR